MSRAEPWQQTTFRWLLFVYPVWIAIRTGQSVQSTSLGCDLHHEGMTIRFIRRCKTFNEWKENRALARAYSVVPPETPESLTGAPAPRENLRAMRRFNGICTGTQIGAAFQGFDRRTVGDVPGVAGLGVDRRNGCGRLVKEGN
ncbi:hypothetical protein BGW80DRAFT_1441480 [Lactifluus volemus]|nr:hypothetical protein BGW80DRAFT_1441480 [Lactifluus volemus]